tara:strand:+ start:9628 stop:9786 length:159 start_codon:yes stop_codon:yes gene_type:complete
VSAGAHVHSCDLNTYGTHLLRQARTVERLNEVLRKRREAKENAKKSNIIPQN